MPVYTVHAPVATDASIAATDRFTFVRDGFHVWAFVFGPLWLVAHRLWLALIGWIAALAAIDFAMTALGASGAATGSSAAGLRLQIPSAVQSANSPRRPPRRGRQARS